jgi:hypothetical protein
LHLLNLFYELLNTLQMKFIWFAQLILIFTNYF